MPPRSATLLDVDVSRQGKSHTCCLCLYFAPYYCEARSSSALALHTSLSVCLSGLLPFSCVPRLPSQLCVLCCQLQACAHRSGIFRPSSVSSLAASVDQQPGKQAPYLCSPLELSSTFGVAALNSVSRQTRGKPCPRSLPVLGPDIGLNLPQATHFPPTHNLFRMFSSLFSAGIAICSSALALLFVSKLTSFAPKHVMAHSHVES